MFTIALLDDQVDFVELFLDHGIKLKRFLDTDDDLSQLYVKVSARVNAHKHTLSHTAPTPTPCSLPPPFFLSLIHISEPTRLA